MQPNKLTEWNVKVLVITYNLLEELYCLKNVEILYFARK